MRLEAKAERQLTTILAWWRRHRREHPALVAEELEDAERELSAAPAAGEEVPRRRGVRRTLLPRSRYWIYYEIDQEAREIDVLAIWHTSRDKGPPLG